MLSLLAAWVLAPALLLVLCVAAGGLGGRSVDPLLRAGLGLAILVAFGGLVSSFDATGELLVPGSLALALAGAVAIARGRRRPDRRSSGAPELRWALVAGAGAFIVHGLAVIATGEATFAGYIKLDDTATWLALTDHVAAGADAVSALPPSTYEATLTVNLGNGYPTGAFAPLALASELSGQDPAWIFQPLLALCAALLAVALHRLARPLVASPALRAAVALIAACSALLLAYALWGAIKELLAAALIATAYALAADRESAIGARAAAVIACAAALALSLSPVGAVWVAGAVVVLLAERGRRALAGVPRARIATAAAVLAALAAVLVAASPLSPFRGSLTDDGDLGNLGSALSPFHLAGIWPAGDFRLGLELPVLSTVLIVIALALALAGLALALRARAGGPVGFVLGSLGVCLAIAIVGSPWVEAKAFAIAAACVPFIAALAAARLAERPGRIWLVGLGSLVALGVGVGWSAVLQIRDANLAPRAQLAELAELGPDVAAAPPTLITEYQPYGARHFLRNGDPEGASELRRRSVVLDRGGVLDKGEFADTDEIRLEDLLVYRSLVLRRSPVQSRPPGVYTLASAGEFYELWERPAGSREGEGTPIEHVGLGDETGPVTRPSCERVRGLQRRARRDRLQLFGAPGRRPVDAPIAVGDYPRSWARADEPQEPLPREPGTLESSAVIDRAGEYELWVRGSIAPLAVASVDGERVGESRGALNNAGGWISFGTAELGAGRHEVELEVGGADLHPGSGASSLPIGPIRLAPTDPGPDPFALGGESAAAICSRSWDWLELVER